MTDSNTVQIQRMDFVIFPRPRSPPAGQKGATAPGEANGGLCNSEREPEGGVQLAGVAGRPGTEPGRRVPVLLGARVRRQQRRGCFGYAHLPDSDPGPGEAGPSAMHYIYSADAFVPSDAQ